MLSLLSISTVASQGCFNCYFLFMFMLNITTMKFYNILRFCIRLIQKLLVESQRLRSGVTWIPQLLTPSITASLLLSSALRPSIRFLPSPNLNFVDEYDISIIFCEWHLSFKWGWWKYIFLLHDSHSKKYFINLTRYTSIFL